MRSTMHILPLDMLPSAFVATLKSTGANADRFLKYRGVSDEEYRCLVLSGHDLAGERRADDYGD